MMRFVFGISLLLLSLWLPLAHGQPAPPPPPEIDALKSIATYFDVDWPSVFPTLCQKSPQDLGKGVQIYCKEFGMVSHINKFIGKLEQAPKPPFPVSDVAKLTKLESFEFDFSLDKSKDLDFSPLGTLTSLTDVKITSITAVRLKFDFPSTTNIATLDLTFPNAPEIPVFKAPTLQKLFLKFGSPLKPISIPDDFFKDLTALTSIDLKGGSLNGAFPSSIKSASQLSELYASGNNFTSILPDTISKLGSLSDLDLSNNQISGTLPDFEGLKKLKSFLGQSNSFDLCKSDPHLSSTMLNNASCSLVNNKPPGACHCPQFYLNRCTADFTCPPKPKPHHGGSFSTVQFSYALISFVLLLLSLL